MHRIGSVLGLLLALASTHDALAQAYPVKPIRIIVPFAPGGPTDTHSRWAAHHLNVAFNQPVIVDNRGGAGGIIGTEAVARAAADGYVLLGGNPGPLTIAPSVRTQLAYDPVRDFSPITLIAKSASCLCVHPSVPAKGIKDFIALAKSKPGRINYATPGVGTVGHLGIEFFATLAGIKMNMVPYKGAALYVVDLMSGNIDFACVQVADSVRAHADKFDQGGHRYSAAHAYLRACNYYQMAERFRTPKDETALTAFRAGVDCFHRHVALTDVRIEIVEVPFEGGSLPGYFVHAQHAQSKRTPCVVYFDGLDVTKEIQYMRGVPDLIKRGISCLVMDGPGTGEAIRFRGQYLRHDYEVAGSACLDWLENRDDVDAKKIGIVAISLGGYYAPRCAALDHRYAACIAWGAQWDYHATWKKRVDAQFKTSLSVPGHHIMWILGVDSLDAALKKLEPFKLDGVMQKIRCPFLLVHGTEDEQIPLADAQKQFDACGSKDKTFRVYTAEEGGSQHCQRDYLTLVVADMWNWFEEKLVRA